MLALQNNTNKIRKARESVREGQIVRERERERDGVEEPCAMCPPYARATETAIASVGDKRYDKKLKRQQIYIYMYNRYLYIYIYLIYIHYKIIIFLYTYTHTNTHTHIYIPC